MTPHRKRPDAFFREDAYRKLFERTEQGFLLADVQMEGDAPVDFLFRDANPAALRLLRHSYVGRLLGDIDPKAHAHWLDAWRRVAATGDDASFEHCVAALDLWLGIDLFCIDEGGCRRVGALLRDIKERRRREVNSVFLAEISVDLAQLGAEWDILEVAAIRCTRHFDMASCHFSEIDELAGRGLVMHDWRRDGRPSLASGGVRYELGCFSAELRDELRRGEPVAIGDALQDARIDARLLPALSMRSMLLLPSVGDDGWRFMLTLADSRPRTWHPDDIALMREVGARLWLRLERSRTERLLEATRRRQGFLLKLSDQIRLLTDPDAILASVAQQLARYLGVAAVGYGEVGAEEDRVRIDSEYNDGRMPSGLGWHRFADVGAVLHAALRAGESLFVAHDASDPRAVRDASGAARMLQSVAFAVVPLRKDDRLVAMLYARHPEARAWSEGDRALLQDVAERSWVAVERARAEIASRRAERQYRELFASIEDGFGICQLRFDGPRPVDFQWLDVNPRFLQLTALAPQNVMAPASQRALLEGFEDHWSGSFAHVAKSGTVARFEAQIPALQRWFDVSAFQTGLPGEHKVAVLIRDITSGKQAAQRLRHASMHDALTGLPNRAMLLEYAARFLPHIARAGTVAAVLFVDLDRFKPINDNHGHDTGDAVLRIAAARLAAALRSEDIVARLGGDEFIILLQDVRDAAGAAEAARHIIDSVSTPYRVGDLNLTLSCSVGISLFPRDGEDIDTLVSHADMAMYQAKSLSRSSFEFYRPEHTEAARQQVAIEQQLKSAISIDGFDLHYQPVFEVGSRRIVSVEALLRMRGADVGPERFVPIAEATGLINPIGCWLLREASRQHRRWSEAGLPPIPIAINVSAVEFRDRDFVQRFRRTLNEEGIDPAALQLEITETAVMADVGHAVEVLSSLKSLGVQILLDDFGTGHSSLAYLARLPLNKLKIDRSFVARQGEDAASEAITAAIVTLGRTLNLEVVAEGVESQLALDYVEAHGCAQVQGFLLGRPMSGDEFQCWYRARIMSVQGGGNAGRYMAALDGE